MARSKERRLQHDIAICLSNEPGFYSRYIHQLCKVRALLFKRLHRTPSDIPILKTNREEERVLGETHLQERIRTIIAMDIDYQSRLLLILDLVDKEISIEQWWERWMEDSMDAFSIACAGAW